MFPTVPPSFTTRLQTSVLVKGQDVQFKCSTQAAPLPSIRYNWFHSLILMQWHLYGHKQAQTIYMHRWFKDGIQLEDNRKHQIQSDVQTGILTLTIKRAEEVDLGQYQCEVPESSATF